MRAIAFAVLAITAAAVAGPALAQDDAAFTACATCHSLAKGQNGVGPSLFHIVGARKAAVAGYAYSDALKAKGGAWTPADLDAYLTDPAKFAPGTKMLIHVKDPAKRAAAVAFLRAH